MFLGGEGEGGWVYKNIISYRGGGGKLFGIVDVCMVHLKVTFGNVNSIKFICSSWFAIWKRGTVFLRINASAFIK